MYLYRYALLIGVLGCGSDDVEGSTTSETTISSSSYTTTSSASYTTTISQTTTAETGVVPWAFPEPYDGLGPEAACETLFDKPHPGATSFWLGDFDFGGGDQTNIVGREAWVLFPNSSWTALGAMDCEIVWDVSGTKSKKGAVSDYAMTLHLEIDLQASNCLEDLVTVTKLDAGVQDTVYVVSVSKDGSAEVSFTSGTTLGVGYTDDKRLTYVSESTCVWF